MLEHEYLTTVLPLRSARGKKTCFFSFADTLTAKAYGRDNECHGWIGCKYQPRPGAEPCVIKIHVRMFDPTAGQQYQAVGIVGVNLLHACFFHHEWIAPPSGKEEDTNYSAFLDMLLDDLDRSRIEIDIVHCSGGDLKQIWGRRLQIGLVERGLTSAAIFAPGTGKPLLPPSSSAGTRRPAARSRMTRSRSWR